MKSCFATIWEGPGPGPLVQNMVNIGHRPGAPRSQRVKHVDLFQAISELNVSYKITTIHPNCSKTCSTDN